MTEAVATAAPLTLSGKFEPLDDCPLTCVELLEGVDQYENEIHAAKLATSEKGGAVRHRIRPIIKDCEGASGLEIADQLWQIAYANCMKAGKATRYCAELTIREGDGLRSTPVRIYFDVKPDNEDVEREEIAANGPSWEYVRGLEMLVLTLTERSSRVAMRQAMLEDKRIGMIYSSITQMQQMKLAESRGQTELVEAQGRNRRKDKLFDGVVGLLPKLVDRFVPDAKKAIPVTTDKPHARLAKLVTTEQLEAFAAALGPVAFAKFEDAADIPSAREVLAALDLETQAAILDAIGRDNVLEIATWD